MIEMDIHYNTDLDQGVQQEPLRMAFLTGDRGAHRFVVHVFRGSAKKKVDLEFAGVKGYFMRSDGSTVIMDGKTEDNCAMVTLPEDCYNIPGRFSLVIKIIFGATVNTVLYVVGTVSRMRTDIVVVPDEPVEAIQFVEQSDGTVLMQGVEFVEQSDGSVLWSGAAFAEQADGSVLVE